MLLISITTRFLIPKLFFIARGLSNNTFKLTILSLLSIIFAFVGDKFLSGGENYEEMGERRR